MSHTLGCALGKDGLYARYSACKEGPVLVRRRSHLLRRLGGRRLREYRGSRSFRTTTKIFFLQHLVAPISRSLDRRQTVEGTVVPRSTPGTAIAQLACGHVAATQCFPADPGHGSPPLLATYVELLVACERTFSTMHSALSTVARPHCPSHQSDASRSLLPLMTRASAALASRASLAAKS